MIKCDQEGCHRPAVYRFYWGGEKFACLEHMTMTLRLAEAIGRTEPPVATIGSPPFFTVARAAPENYGAMLLMQTGDAEFVREIAAHALRRGMFFERGYLWRGTRGVESTRIDTPDEESVFAALGLDYIEPQKRVGEAAFCQLLVSGAERKMYE